MVTAGMTFETSLEVRVSTIFAANFYLYTAGGRRVFTMQYLVWNISSRMLQTLYTRPM